MSSSLRLKRGCAWRRLRLESETEATLCLAASPAARAAVGGRVKFLVDTPETLWGCLDAAAFLPAAHRFLRYAIFYAGITMFLIIISYCFSSSNGWMIYSHYLLLLFPRVHHWIFWIFKLESPCHNKNVFPFGKLHAAAGPLPGGAVSRHVARVSRGAAAAVHLPAVSPALDPHPTREKRVRAGRSSCTGC